MNRLTFTLAAALLLGTSGAALAQAEHEQHHPEGAQAEAEAAPTQPSGQMQMMEGMPEQCRAMMQAMPQECMSAMQQMMQGGMMHRGGVMQGEAGQSSSNTAASEASQAYQQAMDRMHGPMAEAIKAENPDVAFARHDPPSPRRNRYGQGGPAVREGRADPEMGSRNHRGAGT